MALDPDDAEARAFLAARYLSLGFYEAALVASVHALDLDPLWHLPHETRVVCLVRLGRLSEAHAAADHLCREDPDTPTGEFLRASVRIAEGDLEGAEAALAPRRHGLSHPDDGGRAEVVRGLVAALRGEEDEARRVLEKYCGSPPRFHDHLLRLALALGEIDVALGHLARGMFNGNYRWLASEPLARPLFAEPRLRKRLEELHGEWLGDLEELGPRLPAHPAPPAASRSPPRRPCAALLTPPNAHRTSLAGYPAAGHPRRRRGSGRCPPSSSLRVLSTARGRRSAGRLQPPLASRRPRRERAALAALRFVSEPHAGMSRDADASRSPGALWGRGFRPFFLGAGAYGALFVVAWTAIWRGAFPAPAWLTPLPWHGHEMVFGLVAAAIAGFTTTAVPVWTGRAALAGRPLQALFALWAAGRLAMLAAGMLPAGLVAAVDVAFLPALAAVLARHLAGTGQWRNYGVVAIVGVLALANAAVHAEALGWASASASRALRFAVDLVVVLVVVIGGRITPAFTANALRLRGEPAELRSWPAVDRLAVRSVVAVAAADLFAPAQRGERPPRRRRRPRRRRAPRGLAEREGVARPAPRVAPRGHGVGRPRPPSRRRRRPRRSGRRRRRAFTRSPPERSAR